MFENHLPYRSDFQYSHNGALYHHFILGYILHDFLAHIATNWKNAESEKSVSRKKSNSINFNQVSMRNPLIQGYVMVLKNQVGVGKKMWLGAKLERN